MFLSFLVWILCSYIKIEKWRAPKDVKRARYLNTNKQFCTKFYNRNSLSVIYGFLYVCFLLGIHALILYCKLPCLRNLSQWKMNFDQLRQVYIETNNKASVFCFRWKEDECRITLETPLEARSINSSTQRATHTHTHIRHRRKKKFRLNIDRYSTGNYFEQYKQNSFRLLNSLTNRIQWHILCYLLFARFTNCTNLNHSTRFIVTMFRLPFSMQWAAQLNGWTEFLLQFHALATCNESRMQPIKYTEFTSLRRRWKLQNDLVLAHLPSHIQTGLYVTVGLVDFSKPNRFSSFLPPQMVLSVNKNSKLAQRK